LLTSLPPRVIIYLPTLIQELVVGDIALVEPGEVVPCDGIFISGHNVKCDESGFTGESDAIKKLSYADVVESTRNGTGSSQADCFMISGSKVMEGVGKYVVIAVGPKSFNGRLILGRFFLIKTWT
jgi:Ca2+-transporting ATPase